MYNKKSCIVRVQINIHSKLLHVTERIMIKLSRFKGIHCLFAAFCILTFLLLFFVQINIPMQSDDYRYLSLGGDFSALTKHYLNWSGRLAADITSSTILSFFPKAIYSALNSLALVALLLLCSMLPSLVNKEKLMPRDGVTFLVLFFAYWVSNTNLGQTTFWIVGSANYLWTNLYILIFLCVFSIVTSRDAKAIYVPVVFLFGFTGGVTNENTGWITFLFVVFCYLHHRFDERIRLMRFVYASGFLGGLLGWLTLILAPGNSVRANHPTFQGWYSRSIYERVDIHLYDRLMYFLGDYAFVFVLMLFVFAIQMAFAPPEKLNISYEEKSRGVRENSSRKLFLFFIACGLLSALMLVGAPGIAPRTGNGTLIFFLMALSSLMYTCNRINTKISTHIIRYAGILSFTAVYFIPSYCLMQFSIQRTAYQEQVRNDLIRHAIKAGVDSVSIPDFYFSRLLKVRDRFDSYHNGHEMAKYHGGKLKNITKYDVAFDYGAIIKNDGAIQIEREIAHGLILHRAMFYSESRRPFLSKKNLVLFEFNASPSLSLIEGDKRVFFHFVDNTGKIFNSDIGRPSAIKIGNKFYYSRELPVGLLNKDVKSISFGVFDHLGRDSNISIRIK